MPKKDPTRSAQKWAQRMASAGDDYRAGVMAQDVSPTQKAKAKLDTMRARFNEAIDSGKTAAGLDSVSLADWQKAATEKGAQRLIDGARQAQSKVADYQTRLRGEYDRIRDTIRAMPNATEQDRIARMMKNQEMMKALRGKGKRRA